MYPRLNWLDLSSYITIYKDKIKDSNKLRIISLNTIIDVRDKLTLHESANIIAEETAKVQICDDNIKQLTEKCDKMIECNDLIAYKETTNSNFTESDYTIIYDAWKLIYGLVNIVKCKQYKIIYVQQYIDGSIIYVDIKGQVYNSTFTKYITDRKILDVAIIQEKLQPEQFIKLQPDNKYTMWPISTILLYKLLSEFNNALLLSHYNNLYLSHLAKLSYDKLIANKLEVKTANINTIIDFLTKELFFKAEYNDYFKYLAVNLYEKCCIKLSFSSKDAIYAGLEKVIETYLLRKNYYKKCLIKYIEICKLGITDPEYLDMRFDDKKQRLN